MNSFNIAFSMYLIVVFMFQLLQFFFKSLSTLRLMLSHKNHLTVIVIKTWLPPLLIFT